MITAEDLRTNPVFADLPQGDLEWLAAQGQELHLQPGETLFRSGDPADYMAIFFTGEVHMRRDDSADSQVFTARAGDVTGMLPYSRLQQFRGTGRAIEPTRVAIFHKSIFPEMLRRMPVLADRLVSVMMDRVRESTKVDQQLDKLTALGRLSAGLAHELNNPAAAAQRAAGALRETRKEMRAAYRKLDRRNLTPEQREYIAEMEECALTAAASASPVHSSSIELSDREEELAAWMDRHSVPESWKIAGTLAEANVTPAELEEAVTRIGAEALADLVGRVSLTLSAGRLLQEIEQSTGRIFQLVRAIKEYTYMDQAPEQEVDIHEGLESTLTILAYKLRHKSISVVREYDRTLPRICAFGSELNQVWTNLIDNAIDAMEPGGELRVRTWRDPVDLLVSIQDNGSGMSEDVQAHLFEPFFTTKGVGEGTGLGLGTARRIVRSHQGRMMLESKPGETRFTISLPLQKTKLEGEHRDGKMQSSQPSA